MFENQAIHTEHKDVIHDVAYDYYGQRMATCSSDQFVKVSFNTCLSFFSAKFNLFFYSGLGSKREWYMERDSIMESSFWFCLASVLGTSGIWPGSCHLFLRPHNFRLVTNRQRQAILSF